jgi:hypothetical protein
LFEASFQGKKGQEINKQGELPNGLVPDHAYSVLQAVEIEQQKEEKLSKL